MGSVIVVAPEELRQIVKDAVQNAVGQALKTYNGIVSEEMDEHQAAEYMRVSCHTLRGWRSQKKGPAYRKNGKAVRYAKKDLDSWLDGNRVLTIDALEDQHGKAWK